MGLVIKPNGQIVNQGIPEKEAKHLKENFKLNIFVEGGTYEGTSTKIMSYEFQKLYTIEKSEVFYKIAENNLKNIKNITLLKGDTREHLPSIVKNNDNILFWLDAHWSEGETYGENDQCPLMEELKIIFKHNKNHVIMIDDARIFLAPPNFHWPSLADISKILPLNWDLLIFEDVIYLLKNQYKKKFQVFIESRVEEYRLPRLKKEKINFIRKLKNSFKKRLHK